ncbi:unnamed protein product [Paramecium octaurelia]|uniref:Vacuolar protein sorting-associated protein 35 n=1 Tax=Paramecium octaurelia TaxID=43137 RepID=A0A8S1XJD6_PAROT|nr:unnamed protein product [Paramecium octaurelia]
MEEDQEKYLEDARKVVKEQAYFMRASLEKAQLKDALRYSSAMLSELKTSLLSPRNYYILFMQVFDEMRILENYFKEEYRRGRKMPDLYESVQHATYVIPRLYLLITVGSVFIQTHEIGAKVILLDLLECIKAIQHPLRGLFIRYYFLKLCKDRLPDTGSEYEGTGGNIDDAIEIIIRNLSEMNKLWIRMQGSKDKSKRERERLDLKVTIGENVTRLSNLEGVSLDTYKTKVLPKIIDIITSSKDAISQTYLMDCTIQAFPDEYHLQTLQELLKVCTTQLEPTVDIKNIFINLMGRLADFALNNDMGTFNSEVDIYSMFKQNIDKMLDSNSQIEFKNLLDLQVAFLNFTLRCYPSNSEYVNDILKSCCRLCERQNETDFTEECQKNIVKFLAMPLDTMSLSILTMNEYPNLMKHLPFQKRRQVAIKICQAVVNLNQVIDDLKITGELLKFIQPLLITQNDYVEIPENEFEEEQQLVARTVHLVQNGDLAIHNTILQQFIAKFQQGEINRQKYTYPAAIFALFRLIQLIASQGGPQTQETQYKVLFEQIRGLIDVLQGHFPELALKLNLNFLLCINTVDQAQEFDEFSYDVGTQIITIFQDEIGDSNVKVVLLNQIMSTFAKLNCISGENFDTLAGNATQQAAKLLKKNEQAIGVLNAAHMFYNDHIKNVQRVQECFKKAIKIASQSIGNNPKFVYVFIQILNKYFYFFEQVEFKDAEIQEVIKMINEKLPKALSDNDEQSKKIKILWTATQELVRERKRRSIQAYQQINI